MKYIRRVHTHTYVYMEEISFSGLSRLVEFTEEMERSPIEKGRFLLDNFKKVQLSDVYQLPTDDVNLCILLICSN